MSEWTFPTQPTSHDAISVFFLSFFFTKMLHRMTTFESLLSCLIMGNFSMKSGHIDKMLNFIFRTAANFYDNNFTFLNSLIFYFNCLVSIYLCHVADLRVLCIQKLLLGRGNTTVPRAGAVCSLDTSVMVGLASVHLLLDHQVRPETLLRGWDLTGQRGTAHNLQKYTKQSPSALCTDMKLNRIRRK